MTLKLVFVDAEYTGEHAHATLISLGLVGIDGRELYFTLNDYDEDQVSDWLVANVIKNIDSAQSISSEQAWRRMSAWLEDYAEGGRIHFCSAGKMADILLAFELYKYSQPSAKYFHALHHLPPYLNHTQHFDLNTLMFLAGVDSDAPREHFLNKEVSAQRHNALHDARVVRDCFLRLMHAPALAAFAEILSR